MRNYPHFRRSLMAAKKMGKSFMWIRISGRWSVCAGAIMAMLAATALNLEKTAARLAV